MKLWLVNYDQMELGWACIQKTVAIPMWTRSWDSDIKRHIYLKDEGCDERLESSMVEVPLVFFFNQTTVRVIWNFKQFQNRICFYYSVKRLNGQSLMKLSLYRANTGYRHQTKQGKNRTTNLYRRKIRESISHKRPSKAESIAYDHTTLNEMVARANIGYRNKAKTLDLVRSRKLSNVGPG